MPDFIQQELERFDKIFLNPDLCSSVTPLNPIYADGRIGYFIKDLKEFIEQSLISTYNKALEDAESVLPEERITGDSYTRVGVVQDTENRGHNSCRQEAITKINKLRI